MTYYTVNDISVTKGEVEVNDPIFTWLIGNLCPNEEVILTMELEIGTINNFSNMVTLNNQNAIVTVLVRDESNG